MLFFGGRRINCAFRQSGVGNDINEPKWLTGSEPDFCQIVSKRPTLRTKIVKVGCLFCSDAALGNSGLLISLP